jgi:hypothetical protein
VGAGATASPTIQDNPALPSEYRVTCHSDHKDAPVRVHIIPPEAMEQAAAPLWQAQPHFNTTTPQDHQPPPPPLDRPKKADPDKGTKVEVGGHQVKGKAPSKGSGEEIRISVEVHALRDEVQRHWANVAREEGRVAVPCEKLDPGTQSASEADPVTRIAHSMSPATQVAPRQDPVTRLASRTHVNSHGDPASHGDPVTHIASMQLAPAPEDLRFAAVGSVVTVRASAMQAQHGVPTNNLHVPSYDSVVDSDLHAECVVCLVRRARIALIPCGHKCVCRECLPVLQDAGAGCPLCRREIRDAIQIYE